MRTSGYGTKLRSLVAEMKRLIRLAVAESGLSIEEIMISVDALEARENQARLAQILADVADQRRELDAVMRFVTCPAETQSVQERARAMLWVIRRAGFDNAEMLNAMIEPESYSEWRIIVRKRKESETPDRGRRRKRRAHDLEVRNLGVHYHALIEIGHSHVEALNDAQKKGLCKSLATGKKLLTEFNNQPRQYLDSLAPQIFNSTGALVVFPKRSEIRRRGPRPKKRK